MAHKKPDGLPGFTVLFMVDLSMASPVNVIARGYLQILGGI